MVGITFLLSFSTAVRIGIMIWREVIGNTFNRYLINSGASGNYVMPLYFTFNFLLIDFLSSGALLLNFGFAISKKKKEIT